MTTTPNLALPYLDAAQAQKHVTHNEALRLLDVLVMLAVVDRDLAAPPASPADGARYIVAAGATGVWAGQSGKIVAWQDGAWAIVAPRAGFLAYVADENALVVWDGAAWQAAGGGSGTITALDNLTRLGVGTAADTTNVFAAKLNNALWTAKTAAEGGDGTLRYKMNKETAAATLSLLMQTAYAGRAEIGLTGDDDLHVKVSPDGTTWYEAIRVNRANGRLSFPAGGGPREVLTANRTYYVRTDGADTNSGLANTAAGAFLTIQKAVSVVYGALDLGGFNVTIQVGAGTYASGVAATSPQVGAGTITLLGDATTPANVVISTTAATCITASGGARLYVSGFKLVVSGSGNGLLASGNGSLIQTTGAMEFGAMAATSSQISANAGGRTVIAANYTISGGAGLHFDVGEQGTVVAGGRAVTIAGTVAFSMFARSMLMGYLSVPGVTFSGGTVTGMRYSISENSVIRTDGGGASYFPGSAAGSAISGGLYQ